MSKKAKYLILLNLLEREDGMSLHEIKTLVGLTRGATKKVIDKLMSEGHVKCIVGRYYITHSTIVKVALLPDGYLKKLAQ